MNCPCYNQLEQGGKVLVLVNYNKECGPVAERLVLWSGK